MPTRADAPSRTGAQTKADTGPPCPPTDSTLDSRLIVQQLGLGDDKLHRWMGWRLRLLVLAALVGCMAVLLLARWLSNLPYLHAEWQAGSGGQIELAASPLPQLRPLMGMPLMGIGGTQHQISPIDRLGPRYSPRWLTSDSERVRLQVANEQLWRVLSQERVVLDFGKAGSAELPLQPRGLQQLGGDFWLLAALALSLYLVAMVVLLAKPSIGTLMFAVMSMSQSGNLLFMAVDASFGLGIPEPFARLDFPLRVAFDLITTAAAFHLVVVRPNSIPRGQALAWGTWPLLASLGGLMAAGVLSHRWWWAQASVAAMGAVVVGMLSWSYRRIPHPFAIVMRRVAMVALGTWVLLTAAVCLIDIEHAPTLYRKVAETAPAIWHVFLATLLMLSPFISRSRQVMREFSLLAATSTIATSLDLLFVAAFSLGQFASVTLALFISLGLYAGVRQWILTRIRNRHMLTTERMFERLYRVARQVEAQPERTPALLSQLLRELFHPMEVMVVQKKLSRRVRVVGEGSTLLVPVPPMTDRQSSTPAAIVLRFANRGRHLFTSEDARLTDRIVEQLYRAVAFDKAVEQGRSEERLRLAQDLHDDIGARLLTLMYKAQSPEMEDYVRHTLQDLKTLTRGLAAPNRPLSHAAGEWKADLTQRLQIAQVSLGWNLSFDHDISLSVVQWSGLTRVMRELVSNVIAHSQARRVDIDFQLLDDCLTLRVTDDGTGRNPQGWSHGLGLGGIRKRVKQLGGEVEWREAFPTGICCQVTLRQLSERL